MFLIVMDTLKKIQEKLQRLEFSDESILGETPVCYRD